jgi:hypothetical protein
MKAKNWIIELMDYRTGACFQNTERGRPRPQQYSPSRRFSTISIGPALLTLLRPGTGALQLEFENTPW